MTIINPETLREAMMQLNEGKAAFGIEALIETHNTRVSKFSQASASFWHDCFTVRVMGDKSGTSVETDHETLEDAQADLLETAEAMFGMGNKSIWVEIAQELDGRTIKLFDAVYSSPEQLGLANVTQLQDKQ